MCVSESVCERDMVSVASTKAGKCVCSLLNAITFWGTIEKAFEASWRLQVFQEQLGQGSAETKHTLHGHTHTQLHTFHLGLIIRYDLLVLPDSGG